MFTVLAIVSFFSTPILIYRYVLSKALPDAGCFTPVHASRPEEDYE